MNSVLLIGSRRFTVSVIAQVRGLDALSVQTAKTVADAISLIGNDIPEVIIVQAYLLIDNSVHQTFNISLQHTYVVVVEAPRALADTDSLSQSVNGKAALSSEKLALEKLSLEKLSLERKIATLESGADAYIGLSTFPEKSCKKVNISAGQTHSTESLQTQALALLNIDESQQRLLQAYIQIGLSYARRYRDLSRINDWLSAVALVDALTQLSNRRAFDLELPNQIKTARAKGAHLALMVVDIDLFKSVNDRYGHLVGDEVLKLLGQRLLTNMRFYDRPFRYGGEEFVVTLSNTDLPEATVLAERLRQSIEQEPFALSQPVNGLKQLDITISIGLTVLHDQDDPQGRNFLNRADQNLLKAKTKGRNQVVSSAV